MGPSGDSERATREALASARLSHPAIVALYEACARDDAFYLISELVDGDTLARLIAADELEDEEVLEIGLALASALEHAHARGVIHRDIKPQNVLVPHPREDARGAASAAAAAKLTDFGGASLVGEDALTRTGDVLGTLAYMAPEQSEGREVDAAGRPVLARARALRGAVRRQPRPRRHARRHRAAHRPRAAAARTPAPRPAARSSRARSTRALAAAPEGRGTLEELRLALEDALEQGSGARAGGAREAARRTRRDERRRPTSERRLAVRRSRQPPQPLRRRASTTRGGPPRASTQLPRTRSASGLRLPRGAA